ncbi:hypothetical protein LSUB1_G005404 [Lachnellula subtilissima]|uniref:Uncharacterized protein n=1 Tax=Lachnellula subtilissima TaxID=602034 RepID=A0A8H8RX63_9HELO|nr:hypothetical protein LSUB1_G005404 [Lachnellula subtilissima]
MASNVFSANRRRSLSVTPSQRSSRSRITLVENHPGLVEDDIGKSDHDNVLNYRAPKYTWRDHLLGVFCFNVSKGKERLVEEEIQPPKSPQEPEMDQSSSPWILPVYVLSTRRDTEKHHIPKEAKCTIDTGNMQGNIVSRAFVENVLEFSSANFCELTAEEKEGGTGITGHRLIPDGAIYLTWYHKKSTRVFRNMRFLISPHPQCDLIIGARSIQKDKLLSVPNLMDEGLVRADKGRLYVKFKTESDPKRTELYNAWSNANEAALQIEIRLNEAKRNDMTGSIARLEKKLKTPQEKLWITVLELEIYDWGHGKDIASFKLADRKKKLAENYEILEKIEGYNPEDSLLHKVIGSKWKQE